MSDASRDELLSQPLTKWKRPAHLLEPRVWVRENGVVVRDVTPDLYPFVIEHMVGNYMRDEPMCQAVEILDDPIGVAELRAFWQHLILTQGVSLVALKEGTPGANLEKVSAENPPEVIGVNQLTVCTKDDSPMPDFANLLNSDSVKKIFVVFLQCGALENIFERYGVESYLDGAGLSVLPSWRCKGIGQTIVKARNALCKEMGIPITRTVFSAIQSQKVGLKNGFELLGELTYATLKGPDGKQLFPKMHPDQKTIQLMAKKIPK